MRTRLVSAIIVAAGSSMLLGAASPAPSPVDQIKAIAGGSACASYNWPNRGRATQGYMQGMALVFARALCHPERPEVAVVSSARRGGGTASDALDHYRATFDALGMSNEASGPATLRHTYALLIGLGMRESSGRYCVGRDASMNFTTADSAEAGLIQTSFGASRRDPSLPPLHARYKADESGCMLPVFQPGAHCTSGDGRTWGEGEGAGWQELTKRCPAFAVEYGAVVMRVHGGARGEFGPIRMHAAEVKPACDSMLQQVAKVVQDNPAICSAL